MKVPPFVGGGSQSYKDGTLMDKPWPNEVRHGVNAHINYGVTFG